MYKNKNLNYRVLEFEIYFCINIFTCDLLKQTVSVKKKNYYQEFISQNV